jgi:hypothetical protein
MRFRAFALLIGIACSGGLGILGSPAIAQEGAGSFGPAVLPVGGGAVGQTIAQVEVEIASSSGQASRDEAAARAARAATLAVVGRAYSSVLLDAALADLVSAGTIRAASYRTVFAADRGGLGIVVSIDVAAVAQAEAPTEAQPYRFPVVYQDDRSKLTFILGGGFGLYSDTNPWFGAPAVFNGFSPIAGNLPGSSTTWGEAYLEVGIGGVTRLADSDLYLFGAASGIYSFSKGQDIFRDDTRSKLHPGKGYVGLLYASRETGNSAQLSFGRQTWTLNNGFLVSMIAGSSNAGERGATYLGPRNNTDFTALATGDLGRARFALFYVDPDELESLESNTTFAGANFGWEFTVPFSADISYITIPESDSTYRTPVGPALPRAGTNTYGIHALYSPDAQDHLWLEGEYYHQSNPAFDMSAHAWYGTVGHIWKSLAWSPSISYRYASFSGDDPTTTTYERFDSLMSAGYGNWLQGMSFGKVYRNANLNTHRIQFNVAPRQGMNLTFEWHRLRADELNNLGANPALSLLSSSDIGNEYTTTLRWGIDRNRYLQLVASHARPGRALRDIGATEPWTTLQASLYVNF